RNVRPSPLDCSLASRNNLPTGIDDASRISIIASPMSPVAPRIAMLNGRSVTTPPLRRQQDAECHDGARRRRDPDHARRETVPKESRSHAAERVAEPERETREQRLSPALQPTREVSM